MSNLIVEIEKYHICSGISISHSSQHTVNHVLPKAFDPLSEEAVHSRYNEYYRSINCYMISMTEQCEQCITAEKCREKVCKNELLNFAIPGQLNARI